MYEGGLTLHPAAFHYLAQVIRQQSIIISGILVCPFIGICQLVRVVPGGASRVKLRPINHPNTLHILQPSFQVSPTAFFLVLFHGCRSESPES